MLIWHKEKMGYTDKWTSLYKLLSVDRKIYIIALLKRSILFHTTIVKLYKEPINKDNIDNNKTNPNKATQDIAPKIISLNKE